MKRSLSAILVVFFLCFFIPAAQAVEQGLFFGPKLGLNASHVWGSDTDDTEMKAGFAGGGFVGYQFTEWLGAQAELFFYSMKGSGFKGTSDKLHLDYVEIPILGRLTIPIEGSPVVPVIITGPNLAFNVRAKAGSQDIKDNIKVVDFGWVFGGGAEYKLGPGSIGLELRYTLGFISVTKDVAGDPDIKNGALGILAYYSF